MSQMLCLVLVAGAQIPMQLYSLSPRPLRLAIYRIPSITICLAHPTGVLAARPRQSASACRLENLGVPRADDILLVAIGMPDWRRTRSPNPKSSTP